MFTLKCTGNITRINIGSSVVDILLKRQLLQNHLILNLAVMKIKKF